MERTFKVIIDVVIKDDEDFQEILKEDFGTIQDYISGEMQWCGESFYNYKVISIKETK